MKKSPNSGVAMVTLNPPSRQYIPVLSVKISGILTFCLCTKCAETLSYPCTHSKKERQITGCFTYTELIEAINSGYELETIHEIIFFKKTSKIFEAAMNTLAALKIAHSGWLKDVVTREQKEQYIKKFTDQGFKLTFEQVQANPSLKVISKLIINSIWGRLALNTEKFKTLGLIENIEDLVALYKNENSKYKLLDLMSSLKNPKILYKYEGGDVKRNGEVNIILAAFVTSLARLYLLKIIRKLPNLMYLDTDLAIYSLPIDQYDSDIDSKMGAWKDELQELFPPPFKAVCFVALAPKSYAIKAVNMETGEEKYLIKIKGITLKEENAKQDFENLVKLVFKKETEVPMSVQQFRIDNKSASVHYHSMIKILRNSSHKRCILNSINTVAWGTKLPTKGE